IVRFTKLSSLARKPMAGKYCAAGIRNFLTDRQRIEWFERHPRVRQTRRRLRLKKRDRGLFSSQRRCQKLTALRLVSAHEQRLALPMTYQRNVTWQGEDFGDLSRAAPAEPPR